MITSQPTPRPSDPGLGAEEGRARMTAVRTTNPPPTPALSTRTSWPKTILKNTIIAPQPPPRVTASSRGRSMQGNSSVYFYTIIFFILDTNILRNSAAPRSSRAFSVYVDDDREKPSISRFSAAPESRSYRLVAPGVGLLSTVPRVLILCKKTIIEDTEFDSVMNNYYFIIYCSAVCCSTHFIQYTIQYIHC